MLAPSTVSTTTRRLATMKPLPRWRGSGQWIGSINTSGRRPRLGKKFAYCSGGLLLKAARCRACASRTADDPAIRDIAGAHRPPLQLLIFHFVQIGRAHV